MQDLKFRFLLFFIRQLTQKKFNALGVIAQKYNYCSLVHNGHLRTPNN